MQQRRTGVRNIIIGVIIVIVVLGAGLFLTSRGGGGSAAKPAGTPVTTQSVVVAQYPIPQGTTFQAGQDLSTEFTTRQLPSDAVPFGAYTSLKEIQAVLTSASCGPVAVPGCRGIVTSSQTIFQNEPVVTGMLSSLGAYRTSAGPAFQIPYGYVAISVDFTSVNSVVGSINPGDDVDLIASNTGAGGTGEGLGKNIPTQTQYVLNDVRVIGVGGPPAQPPPPPTPTPGPGIHSGSAPAPTPVPVPTAAAAGTGGTLVLLVRYQEALIIQHLKDFAGTWTMSTVLRSAKETDIPHFKTLPVTARWFFTKQANHFDLSNPY
jgi:Flp pilus assembly protein CpaB